ncbi:MAG: hypothetical protein LBQ38_13930 [Spirochaetaceae bacterium]|nr:hypothetical protein [Spirochaetaceae bacterium]
MTASHKAALSLLLAVIFFAGFAVLAFTEFFDFIETRFYNPSVTRTLHREIDQDTRAVEGFLGELQDRFTATLEEGPVRRSFLPNQSAEDIFERSRLFGLLLETQSGLQSVRFIDAGGSRIHYSTYGPDILRQDGRSVVYRNYGAGSSGEAPPGYVPYDRVAVPDRGGPKISPDRAGERLIFSHPFYDDMDVYRGTALFSLSVRAVSERLIGEGRIKIGEDVSVVDDPPGLISRLPPNSRETLIQLVASIWSTNVTDITSLDLDDTDLALALISSKTAQEIFIGRLVDEALFLFPAAMKFILLASFLTTVYLTIFLLFNLSQDPMTIVKTRINTLRETLIDEYYSRKEEVEWVRWTRELEQRREEVRGEIKRDIRPRRRRALEKEIDACIDTAWGELLAVLKSRIGITAAQIDEARLREIVNRVLEAATGRLPPGQAAVPGEDGKGLINPGSSDYAESGGFEVLEDITEEADLEELDEAIPGDETPEQAEDAEAADLPDNIVVFEEVDGMKKVDPTDETPAKAGPAIPVRASIPAEAVPEAEELEDLEELEELEETEIAEEAGSLTTGSGSPESEAANLASQIEFSPLPEAETSDEESLAELEVVSPFDTMLSKFTEGPEEDQDAPLDENGEAELAGEYAGKGPDEKKNFPVTKTRHSHNLSIAKLESIDTNYHMFLISKPFTAACPGTPPILETTQQGTVIEYRNGISYINQTAAADEEPEEPRNIEFKKLVESVLNKN